MPNLINFDLISNPLNWITVALMLLIALFVVDSIVQFQRSVQGENDDA